MIPLLIRRLPNLRAITLLVCTAVAFTGAAAQEPSTWPDRPVRILAGSPPGAATDNITRRIAEGLTQRLGENVFVENRVGAMTMIATRAAVNSKPDGYTLLAGDPTLLILPLISKSVPYDLDNDLVPVAAYSFAPLTVVVNAASPYKTLQDLLSAAKEQPLMITYGSSGEGTSTHLLTEALAARSGVKLMHVPYKGAAEAVLAVMSGQLDMQIVVPNAVMGQVKSGHLRMLAVTGDARSVAAPEVPTFLESGVNYNLHHWVSLWAPHGTPSAIRERLSREVVNVVQSPMVSDYLKSTGALQKVVVGSDFEKMIGEERIMWQQLTESIGLEKR